MTDDARQPDAIMSYTHFDDDHNSGHLTLFCTRLSQEVRAYTGHPFHIFQGAKDIKWGEPFAERIDAALDTVQFFIPILTPSFFQSAYCRAELQHFLRRAAALQRNDLILPVYYIESTLLERPVQRETDRLARELAAHQYVDWRDLRFESFESLAVRRMLAQMARQIRDALDRIAAIRRLAMDSRAADASPPPAEQPATDDAAAAVAPPIQRPTTDAPVAESPPDTPRSMGMDSRVADALSDASLPDELHRLAMDPRVADVSPPPAKQPATDDAPAAVAPPIQRPTTDAPVAKSPLDTPRSARMDPRVADALSDASPPDEPRRPAMDSPAADASPPPTTQRATDDAAATVAPPIQRPTTDAPVAESPPDTPRSMGMDSRVAHVPGDTASGDDVSWGYGPPMPEPVARDPELRRLWKTAFDPTCEPDPRKRNAAAEELDRQEADTRTALDLSHPDYWAQRIEPGAFLMGDDNGAWDNEKPAFTSHIRRPYALARFPVTNRQYLRFLQDLERQGRTVQVSRWFGLGGQKTVSKTQARRPHYGWNEAGYPAGKGNHPVVDVSWEDACAFADWVNKLLHAQGVLAAGEEVRLPTEPEWERAAACPMAIPPGQPGAGKCVYPWGNDWQGLMDNHQEASLTARAKACIIASVRANVDGIVGGTSVVGIFPHGASACAAEELAGSVWEWCSTAYQSYPLPDDIAADTIYNTVKYPNRTYVLRGGSWSLNSSLARCARRYDLGPGGVLGNVGVRPARLFS